MTNQKEGRFCGSCQKLVVDFTAMSDDKLIAYFKNYSGNNCGRFTNDQLNRELASQLLPRQRWYNWAFAIMISSFLVCSKIKAQGKITLTEQIIQKKSTDDKESRVLFDIKGKISNESEVRVPYASIVVKNENWGTCTDSLGNFSIKINSTANFIELLISSVGYSNKEVVLNFEEAVKYQTIVLKAEDLQNEIIITGYSTTRHMGLTGTVSTFQQTSTKLQKAKKNVIKEDTVLDHSFKIYPNPAKTGSTIKLQFNQTENYLIKLINLNGQVISTQYMPVF